MAMLKKKKNDVFLALCFAVGMVLILQCMTTWQTTDAFQPHHHHAFATRQQRAITDSKTMNGVLSTSRKTTSLSMTSPLPAAVQSVLSAIASPLVALTVLAGVVLIHEAGHYLAARSLGIRVEEFSVGIGPKLAGFQGKHTEEFNLRLVPLGGYVRFPENYNTTLVQAQEREMYKLEQAEKEEANKKRLTKEERTVTTAKTTTPMAKLVNVLTFGLTERLRQQQQQERKRQEKQQQSSSSWFQSIFSNKKKQSPKKAQQQQKKKKKSIEIDYYDDPDLLQNRPWTQRALVLSGGIIFNLLLAFSCYFGQVTVGNGLPHPVFEQGAVVHSVTSPTAPSAGILKPGDVIVGINGSPLSPSSSKSLTPTASQQAITDLISTIRETPPGDSVQLEVLRAAKLQKPPPVVDVTVQPKPLSTATSSSSSAITNGPQSIGVMLAPNYVRTEMIRSSSIGEAAFLSGRYVMELSQETAASLLTFFRQLTSNKNGTPAQMSGPIGLVRTGSQLVATNDIGIIIAFVAAVSINLAVINALPLPALDGGQLVFVLAEAVTGKKLDQQLQEEITFITLLFLLIVSLGTAIGDVESIFLVR